MSASLGRVSRGETYAGYTDLEVEACGVCGVLFAAPAQLLKKALADHSRGFYCPNGHHLFYQGKTKEQKERERANWAEQRAANEQHRREQAEAEARVQKGRATRFKNDRDKIRARIAEGVCPCCNRQFKNVQRHMAGQHPEFKVPDDA